MEQFKMDMGDGRTAHCYIMVEQPYSNMVFRAGVCDGIPPDTVFVQWERPPTEPTTLFLRPDEAQALAWVINGALWSHEMGRITESRSGSED